MSRFVRWGMVGLSGVLGACAAPPQVQTIRYPWAVERPARPEACELTVVGHESRGVDRCEALGDVFVGDSGCSSRCDGDRVMQHVEAAACRFGADTVTLRQVVDENSTCVQVRAQLWDCTGGGTP